MNNTWSTLDNFETELVDLQKHLAHKLSTLQSRGDESSRSEFLTRKNLQEVTNLLQACSVFKRRFAFVG